MRRIFAFAMAVSMCLSACGTPPPRLAEGLRANNRSAPDPAWDQRLRERFPVGSEESSMLKELRKQRFKVSAVSAYYTSADLVCSQTWTIAWHAENGRITDISGVHNGACL